MKSYDWSKAQSLVDAYLNALQDKHSLCLGRTWLEVKMAEVGLIESWRDFKFGESHAAWYACLIRTRNIGRVTKAESNNQRKPSKTAETIRKIRFGRLRGSPTSQYLETMLLQ